MSEFKVITTAPAGSPDWLEKHPPLGSGDVASIIGVGRKSKMRVFSEATGKLKKEDISDKPAIRRGLLLEPLALSLFGHDANLVVDPSPGLIQHPTLSMVGITPDAAVGRKPVEAKTVGQFPQRAWKNGAPLLVQVQNLLQAAVMEAPSGYIAGFMMPVEDRSEDEAPDPMLTLLEGMAARHRNDPALLETLRPMMRWQELPFDREAHERICFAVLQFWELHVVKDIPPEVTADDIDTIKELFPRETKGNFGPLEPDIAMLWEAREAHRDAIQEEAKRRGFKIKAWHPDEYEVQIKLAMQDKEFLQGPGYCLQYRVEPRSEYTVAASEPRVLRKVKGLS